MRNTRARALGAGLAGVTFAAALTLPACHGPDVVSLGEALPSTPDRFLSPAGDDHNTGASTSPWKTFAFALTHLAPGATLQLESSATPYDDATTGTLNVRCADATPGSPAPFAVKAMSGLPAAGMAITIRAVSERGLLLRGNGHVPPITIDSCHDWKILGLQVESQDAPDDLTTPDTGSVVVLVGKNDNVKLLRLLARHPNRYKRSNVLRIDSGASRVTVEECELYDFHHSAIEVARSSSIVLQRNYINSRDTPDKADGWASEDPSRGDWGVLLEETSLVYAENNIVEKVHVGFGVVGRANDVGADVPAALLDNNYLLGNIVNAPTSIGFRIDSQCQGLSPCDDAHTVRHTKIDNDVVVGGEMGVSDAGSIATSVSSFSVLAAARGIDISKEPQNLNVPASSMVVNTLVDGYQSVAFAFSGTNWVCDHCAAVGGYNPDLAYFPFDPQRVTKVDVTPALGECLVYLPTDSPLRTAGGLGLPVGANVLQQYDDSGSPNGAPLWTDLGGFSGCGAIVDANTDSATNPSCGGVGARLHVGPSNGCPFP